MTAALVRSSERLSMLALAALLAVTLLVRPGGWALRAVFFLGLPLSTLYLARRTRPLGLLRDFLPILAVLGSYLLLQPLVAAVHPARWDAALAAADARWFGPVAAAWRGAFGRPAVFTDLVYAAYASFYLLPLAVAVMAHRRLGPARFERIVFALLLGFYLSFLGYFLWPAEGPRIPQAREAAELGGGAVSQAVRAFLRGAETTTLDAFPSGHTAISLLSAALASRPFPRLAAALWAWALAIVFATVYISVHYLVDVAAGALLAAVVLVLGPALQRRIGPDPEGAR
jgi:membrane-associated phospholipid phosphatase